MKLADDWKLTLKKAWSIRLLVVAGILSAAEFILPLYTDIFPRSIFALLNLIVIPAAFISRIVSQKEFDET